MATASRIGAASWYSLGWDPYTRQPELSNETPPPLCFGAWLLGAFTAGLGVAAGAGGGGGTPAGARGPGGGGGGGGVVAPLPPAPLRLPARVGRLLRTAASVSIGGTLLRAAGIAAPAYAIGKLDVPGAGGALRELVACPIAKEQAKMATQASANTIGPRLCTPAGSARLPGQRIEILRTVFTTGTRPAGTLSGSG